VREFYRWPAGGFADAVLLYLQYAMTGRTLASYWYIPFILLMFAASPLFVRFIGLTRRSQLVGFGCTVIISVIVHRPLNNDNPFHSVLYFSSAYLLGILISAHRDQVFPFVKQHALALGAGLGIICLVKVLVDGDHQNKHKAAIFSFNGIDVFIVQKYVQAAVMLSLLLRFADRRIPALHYVAERSFAIFFLHNWIPFLFGREFSWLERNGVRGFFTFTLIAALSFVASIAAADVLRAVLKERSRYLIGY
jgi:hypothetical protein